MESIEELTLYVAEKARQYLEETGEVIEKYPLSIVDFVIEFASVNIPKRYTEKQIVFELERCKNTIAMACNDIYSKIGAEGQSSHSENGTSRAYDSSWISPALVSNFPNYVTVL